MCNLGTRSTDSRIKKYLQAAQRPFLLGIIWTVLAVLEGSTPVCNEAGERHSSWIESSIAKLEGKPAFDCGPHLAEQKRRWKHLESEEAKSET